MEAGAGHKGQVHRGQRALGVTAREEAEPVPASDPGHRAQESDLPVRALAHVPTPVLPSRGIIPTAPVRGGVSGGNLPGGRPPSGDSCSQLRY